MKTILTFGVFDVLHIGHVLLFDRAKKLGDKLIVAVQEDEYILKYKPDTKKIYSTAERCYMVGAIRYVDEVTTYEAVDKDIQRVDFDILVIGPDQKHAGFQCAVEWCRANGKEVITIPRTEGISSSFLKQQF